MRRAAKHNRGYVLLLTLGVIALASISLAGFARHSLTIATCANESVDELQRRWGLLSIRHVLLERAAQIVDAQVPDDLIDTPPWPKPAQLSANFALGGQNFSVILSDEDAKLDLNAVYARKRTRLLPAMRQATRDLKSAIPDILLSPSNVGPAFVSWGQLFDLPRTFENVRPSESLISVSKDMTCWNSGHLNVRRASDTALRETASLALSPKDVSGLIQNRKNWGGHGVEELLDDLGLKRPEYLAARRLLGTESSSFSLWVTVSNETRKWSYLYVESGKPIAFAW